MSKTANIILMVGTIAVSIFMLGMAVLLVTLGYIMPPIICVIIAGGVGVFAYNDYRRIKTDNQSVVDEREVPPGRFP